MQMCKDKGVQFGIKRIFYKEVRSLVNLSLTMAV